MKSKTVFVCNECGNENPKWLGKCPACGTWNSMFEQRLEPEVANPKTTARNDSLLFSKNTPQKLDDIELVDDNRFTSGISELDRVLGGGIVTGSLVLVGGDPGIGKSTLLLQMCQTAAVSDSILYASGEESQKQIKIRSQRLNINNKNLLLMSENNLDSILSAAKDLSPKILIIDSVQTIYKPDLTSAPGSVSQVREVTMSLMKLAKDTGIVVFLVGHVTKDGALAGPKILEHMVDCVLYFEGEQHQFHRILRAAKNRFGSTNEIGVFEMCDSGLKEVKNPSEMLLSGRPKNAAGSCVICAIEGTRPILAEIQALVSGSSFNIPRRMSTGIDQYRVAMLMAVLEKRVGLNLMGEDAYINVIGGLRIDEPAADLGVTLAIASSFRNIPLEHDIMAIGEVGLTGELRCVNFIEKRVIEAAKMGFTTCIIPVGNAEGIKFDNNVKIIQAANVRDALSNV
ncbi:MAG: DNA repair protein RadA [Clostridiales bacterium]|jgi:DNA repair protein RadA/Sms|nr:DNA repair protein RadA [Clostridiales bacterium]